MFKRIFTFFVSFLFVSSLFAGRVFSSQNILFSDDFGDGNDNGWTKITSAGPPSAQYWKVKNGQYGARVPSSFTLTESVVNNLSWGNYVFEFDMKGVAGVDKNFILRWTDNPNIGEDYGYDIHQSFNYFRVEKMGPNRFDPNVPVDYWPAPVYYPTTNGQTYHWKAELNGKHIKISVTNPQGVTSTLFDFDDNNNPYLKGGVGFRIETGTVFPTEVYFDNITVTGIDNSLPVPFFSQRNNGNNWWNQTYDHVAKTISDWGCAMTSAAMVLRYHGFTKGPDGQDTNPLTLNEYLKNNNGYNDVGGVRWPVVTQYAERAKDNGQVDGSLRSLEFLYSAFDKNLLKSDYDLGNPDLIKIIMDGNNNTHFAVAKNIEGEEITLNDPLQLEDNNITLSQGYGDKTYRQIGRFIPSNTDLSYIWLNLYNLEADVLVEYEGNQQIPNAQYFEENPFFDWDGPNEQTSGSKLWLLPKPAAGQYKLTFSAPTAQNAKFDVSVFDEKAEEKFFKDKLLITPNTPGIFLLTIGEDDSVNLNRQVTFATLRSDLLAMQRLGNIKNSGLVKSFLKLIDIMEQYYPAKISVVKKSLALFEKYLTRNYPKYINLEAYQLLSEDVRLLRSYLLP